MKAILFKSEMIRRILAGKKTMTRRMGIPRFGKGDKLYVKETFIIDTNYAGFIKDLRWKKNYATEWGIFYKADVDADDNLFKNPFTAWKSALFMPQKYARIFLKITNVKIEKLFDISVADAQKEGFYTRQNFWDYFREINKITDENYNPYVVVYEFRRIAK